MKLRCEKLPISVTRVIPATIITPFFDKARTKLGVKSVAPPPIYLPGIVPEAIFHVAENPAQDLVIEGAAKAVILSQALSPRLLDVLLGVRGFEVHYTREPNPEGAPDNLFEPIDGHDTVEGSFRDQAHSRSLYSSLRLHPAVKRGAVAGMMIGALGDLLRRMQNQHEGAFVEVNTMVQMTPL